MSTFSSPLYKPWLVSRLCHWLVSRLVGGLLCGFLCVQLLAAPSDVLAQTAPAPSPPDPETESETDPETDPETLVSFGGWAQLQVSGVLGDNLGVVGGPELNIGDHAIGLSLFVAGGTHLRSGVELRYRWQIIDRLAWWFAPGIAFDVLFVDDYTVWSRLTMFSTGVDIALSDLFYVGVDFTVSPRVAPLSVTFVDDGEFRRQVEHGSDEFPYDLAYGFLRPGVSFGIRL